MNNQTTPTLPPNSRIIGFDIARAFAIFGMVMVNFKIVMGADKNGPDWLVFIVGLLEGRAAATFVVLAGIGISLLSKSVRESGDPDQIRRTRNTLLKRALFLFVLGSLYTSIWPADILHFYGIYIAIVAFLFAWSTVRLWGVAIGTMLGFVALLVTFDYEVGWNFETFEYAGFWTPTGFVRHLFFNGFHPVIPWLSFMVVGLILGRLDWSNSKLRTRLIIAGGFVALSVEFVSVGLVKLLSSDLSTNLALLGTSPMPPMPQYIIAGTATACVVIALSVSLGHRFADARWLKPLVSTGQIALTLYIAHVFIGMGTLESMGQLENQTLPYAVGATTVFCLAGVVFATAWRTRFNRGPVEWVMRKLTESR